MARLGILKDDTQFFTTALQEVRQKAAERLFPNDDEANVRAARMCGIDAHFYQAKAKA